MSMTLFSHPRVQALQWSAYRFIDRLGLAGQLALVVAALSGGLFFVNGYPLYQQLCALNAALEQKKTSQALPDKKADPHTALNAYVAQFPSLSQKNRLLNQWMQIAEQNDLLPDSVVYKAAPVEKLALLQPTVVDFSLYASYADIQHFLNQVMTQMPFVAIERLVLSKEEADEDAISAHIQLKFYFATPPFDEERRQ